jgi:hypothetical protein
LRVARVLAKATGVSYEIGAGDERPHRRGTRDGNVVVGRRRFILRNTLSHRVLLESHSDWHVRFGFMPTRIGSALAIAGVIRDRNRSCCGCARRSEPRSMGAVVAGRSTSHVRLAPPWLTGHPRRCKLPLSFGDPHACGGVSNGCCDVSSPRETLSETSATSPPKPAIACTSWPTLESSVGGSTAKPPSPQSNPT